MLGHDSADPGPWRPKNMVFDFSCIGFIIVCHYDTEMILLTWIETEFYMVSWVLSHSLSLKPHMFDSTLKGHLELLTCISINGAYNFSRFLQNISDCKWTIVLISFTTHFCKKSGCAIYYVLLRMCLTVVFWSNKIVISWISRIIKTHKTVQKVESCCFVLSLTFFPDVMAITDSYNIVVFSAYFQNVVKT
jgi:hypothetical protein